MRYFVKTPLLKFLISFLCLTSGFATSNVSAATSTTYPVGMEPKAVAVADFSNDGKNDLATVNRSAHNVSILLGDGAGNFGSATNFSTGDTFSEPFALAVGDFNNDGKTDVVVSKPNVHLISLLLGNGSGGLGAPVDFSVGENPAIFGVGDFNGDSKSDLAVGDGGNNGGVYILLGTGTGSFGSPTKFTAGPGTRYIAVADFNRDNKSDLAVANVAFNFNKISILLGNGTGGFSAPTNFAVGSSPIGLVVRDFNKDTFLDIAVANADSHNVSILKGDGQGSFGAATNFPANSFPLSITSGDFDGDGKLDLAVGANSTDNRISILRGDDTGQFTSPALFSAGSGPQDLATGDFTGNGASGLAVANASGNTVSVLIGPFPSVSIGSASVAEGDSGTVSLSFPLTLSGSINQPVTIIYSLTSGTAVAGGDFDSATSPVTIPAAGQTGNLVVQVNGDQTFEPDETFTVNISGSSLNAFITNGQGQGTIENDDPVPAITINDAAVVEGNSGFRSIVFDVTLSNPSFQAIAVTATTADRTAAAGSDYVAKSAGVNIGPNQVNAIFSVAVSGDAQSEPNETLLVNLTNPVNASVARSQAIGTIVDDDPAALVVDGTQRAVALDSVTYLRDPFAVVNTFNFSSDSRSRIVFFAVDLKLVAGDVVTVQAEDAQHVNHELPVEFTGTVPGFGGLSQIVVRLADNLGTGDFLVSFTLRGVTSNKGLITIKP